MWAAVAAQGGEVPEPFLVGGAPGVNKLFSWSAVREAIALWQRASSERATAPVTAPFTAAHTQFAGTPRRMADRLLLSGDDFVERLRPAGQEEAAVPGFLADLQGGGLEMAQAFWC